MRILLVEDNLSLAEQYADALSLNHYVVDVAEDGHAGWELAQTVNYDLVILDVMLPKLDGVNLCRQMRDRGNSVPVLMLTAKSTDPDKVLGLDSGADDYLVKPVGLEELNARIRALLRRQSQSTSPVLGWGQLRLDPSTCEVTYGSYQLRLTPKEYALLELMLRNPQRVYSRQAILEQLWAFDAEPPSEDTVKAHIKGLRQKLKTAGAGHLVETVYGLGYRLHSAASQALPASDEIGATAMADPIATPPVESLSDMIMAQQPLLLIVDADQDWTQPLVQEAATWGLRTLSASTSVSAHEMIRRSRPDVILLDLSMPAMVSEGMALLADLAAQLASPPVLVVIDPAQPLDRAQITRLQGKGFLNKSLSPSQVLATVLETLDHSRTNTIQILAMHEDLHTLDILETLLRPWGIQICTLSDPTQLWERLATSLPDLLLLDATLSSTDSLELCRTLRNDACWGWLPVIFLSATSDSELLHQLFVAGADDYVSKPFIGPELVTRIVNRLERTRLLQSRSHIDRLTGLISRTQAIPELNRFLQLAKRSQQPVCLAVLEIDNLKAINQHYSYQLGDRALQCISQQLRRELRREDVIARWGGAELVLGMYGMSRYDGIEWLASILETLRENPLQDTDGTIVPITYSAGVAQYPQDGSSLQPLYQAASLALQQAKQHGSNRVFGANWQPTNTMSFTNASILILHPDPDLAASIMQALETRGYSYYWLKDGQTAVTKLMTSTLTLRTQLILLGDELPGLSGLDVLRQLSQRKLMRQTRVIWLTQNSATADRALALGAFDYGIIPCQMSVLMPTVRRALEWNS